MLPRASNAIKVAVAGKGVGDSEWPTYASNRGQLMIQVTRKKLAITGPLDKAMIFKGNHKLPTCE